MDTLAALLDHNVVRTAELPAKNTFTREELALLDAYTVPLIAHDYSAKTPAMWNTLYEQLGLNMRNIMVVADPKHAQTILQTLRHDPRYLGGGCGVGFKEAVIPYLDERRPGDIASVNIIVKENKRLVGYNTDSEGLLRSIEEKCKEIGKSLEGATVVVFGAGGVAKGLVPLLAEKKVKRVPIANRTVEKATEIAYRSKAIAYSAPEEMIRGIVLNSWHAPDVIVNTTEKGADGPLEAYCAFAHTTGSIGDNNSIARTILRELALYNPQVIIADIVLSKSGRTTTLRFAEAAGIKNLIDGVPMVIYQGVAAFQLVAKAHPALHKNVPPLEEILAVFKKATKNSF